MRAHRFACGPAVKVLPLLPLLALALAAGCDEPPTPLQAGPRLEPIYDAPPRLAGCVYASPLAVESRGRRYVLAASADGTLAALDGPTGAVAWQLALPARAGLEPYLLSTPVVVGHDLFVAYQERDPASRIRQHHVVLAIDLEAQAIDPAFPTVELDATVGAVSFNPMTQALRSPLVHGVPLGATLGRVYVSLGNIQDLQPWHGWVFELDLDAWHAGGQAISGTLLTTAQSDCGTAGASGARDTRCGGGVWSPSGPVVITGGAAGYELIVPTGNGHLDLAGGDFANTLMRTGPGLAFQPGCDASACAGFDGLDPQPACLDTCRDLFVPRLLPGEPAVRPESGACDGKTLLGCYATLDWDLGADTPQLVPSADALAMPGKDGAVYLVDHQHLGTLLDRRTVAQPCGTAGNKCSADWAGMIVSQPLVVGDAAGETVIVPTFEYDRTHPAGLVALRVADRKLEPLWTAPDFASDEARAQFRHHPGRATAVALDGETYVFVVDVKGDASGRGLFYGVRARDGVLVERRLLAGAGQRFVQPLLEDGALYVGSCASDDGPGTIEAFRITRD